MTLIQTPVAFADARSLFAGPERPRFRRGLVARLVGRMQLRHALWSLRCDLTTIPDFVLSDIGIPPDGIDRVVRRAALTAVRRALRVKLARLRRRG